VGFEEPEIRNPKPEIRTKSESPNENKPRQTAQHPTASLPVNPIGEFELVSDFGFRDSDFRIAQPSMSANAFGSDSGAPGLEAGTRGKGNLSFRDLLNLDHGSCNSRFDIPIWHFKSDTP
jgi:hypothetical protein